MSRKRGRERGEWEEEVAQTLFIHVSKCKIPFSFLTL
jgi:hypothetical protein